MVSSWAIVPALLLLQERAPTAQVEQKHDVSTLLAVDLPQLLTFDLAPVSSVAKQETLRRSLPEIIGPDLVELLTRLLKSGGVTEPVKLDTENEDEAAQLVVVGSPAVQQEVDRLLKAIEEALRGPADLELHLLALDGDAPLPFDAAILGADEAERREAELLKSKRGRLARVARARPIDGRVTTVAASDVRRRVDHFSVEIGLGPIHYEPVVDEDAEGLTAELRIARLDGATCLDLALRGAETVEPARELLVEPTLWYHEPRSDSLEAARAAGRVDVGARMFHGKVPLKLDLPVHRFTSFAGSFVLPDGKALWIQSRVAARSGTSTWIVVVRERGPARPLVSRLSRDGDARQIALVHIAGLEEWSFDAIDYSRQSFDDRGWSHARREGDAPQPDADWPSYVRARPGAVRDLDLPTSFSPFEVGGAATEAERFGGQWFLVDAPSDIDAALRKQFAADLAPPASYEIHGRVLRGGALAAEFLLPVAAGRSATLWSGFDGAALRSWDVDVANIEQVGVPIVAWHLDGVALTFVATPVEGGEVALTTRGVVSFLDAPPAPFSTGNPETPTVEVLKTHRLLVDDASSLAPDGGKPLTIGGSACTLEVTLVAR